MLQDVPPLLRESEPSDEDQDLSLIRDGDPCKGEGCIHILELVHAGLEFGSLPQTIKFELDPNFMVKQHISGPEGLLNLIPVSGRLLLYLASNQTTFSSLHLCWAQYFFMLCTQLRRLEVWEYSLLNTLGCLYLGQGL